MPFELLQSIIGRYTFFSWVETPPCLYVFINAFLATIAMRWFKHNQQETESIHRLFQPVFTATMISLFIPALFMPVVAHFLRGTTLLSIQVIIDELVLLAIFIGIVIYAKTKKTPLSWITGVILFGTALPQIGPVALWISHFALFGATHLFGTCVAAKVLLAFAVIGAIAVLQTLIFWWIALEHQRRKWLSVFILFCVTNSLAGCAIEGILRLLIAQGLIPVGMV